MCDFGDFVDLFLRIPQYFDTEFSFFPVLKDYFPSFGSIGLEQSKRIPSLFTFLR